MFGDPDDFTPRLIRRLAARDTRGRERDAIRWYAADRLRGRPPISRATMKAALISALISFGIVALCAMRF
ncbi:MAG: hypothetical protein KGL35_13495 [Bradyrhizobium sp.]|nr:hypothetical protein [Bradyrhizobium sp.]